MVSTFLSEISINFSETEARPQILQGVLLAKAKSIIKSVSKSKIETIKRKTHQYVCVKCKKNVTYDKRGVCQKCLVKNRTDEAKTHDFAFKKGPRTSKVIIVEKCPDSPIYGHHWQIDGEQGVCKYCKKEKTFSRRLTGVWTKA